MGGIAVIGNLARDTIDGGQPRVGGAPYHAARGLRLLGGDSRIVARCAEADRRALVPPLSALGVPVTWLPSPRTTAFEIRYDGEEREMTVGDPGAPWTVADARAVGRAAWVHLGGLTRADFPADVLAALARDRRLALDGQALVRPCGDRTAGARRQLRPGGSAPRDGAEAERGGARGARRRGTRPRARRARIAAHQSIRRRGRDRTRRAGARARETDRDRRSDRRRRCLPRGVHLGASIRAQADFGSSPGRDDRRARARDRARARARAEPMV